MNNEASFQRLAAVTSILAALLAFGSIGLQAVVLGVNTDPFSNPTHILGIGIDLLGSRKRHKRKTPWQMS